MRVFLRNPWLLALLSVEITLKFASGLPSLVLSGNESLKVTEGCAQWWHPADLRYCFYEATYNIKLASAPSSGNVTVELRVSAEDAMLATRYGEKAVELLTDISCRNNRAQSGRRTTTSSSLH